MPLTRGRRSTLKTDDYVKPIFRRSLGSNVKAKKEERNVAVVFEGTRSKTRSKGKRSGQFLQQRNQRRRKNKSAFAVKSEDASEDVEKNDVSTTQRSPSELENTPEALLTAGGTEEFYSCAVGELRRGSVVLVVLAVRHYIQDRAYWFTVDGTCAELSTMDADAFDITFCHPGERMKTRVCLHPRLNFLVQRGALRRGSIVEVSNWSRRLNESRGIYAHQIVVVHECKVLRNTEDVIRLDIPSESNWTPSAGPLEIAANVPLASSRKAYLGPGAFDALPVDSRWRNLSDTECVSDTKSLRSLADLSTNISGAFANGLRRPIVGRILQKTAIAPWPRRCDLRQSLPLKFEFIIGDGRDTVRVVAWNSVCLRYYCHLHPGDIVCIDNYRIRGGEIHLNPTPHLGTVRKLTESCSGLFSFGPIWRIGGGASGELFHPCIPATDIDSWEDGTPFSLTGIVTYVSPLFRERETYRSTEREGALLSTAINSDDYFIFKKYRILLLRDGSEARDVFVRLYETSQRDEFDAACEPGAAILLTALEKREKYNSPLEGVVISEIRSTKWTAIYRLDSPNVTKDPDNLGFSDGLPGMVRENPLVRRLMQALRFLVLSQNSQSKKLKQIFSLDRAQHCTFRYVDTLEAFASVCGGVEKVENMRVEFDRVKILQENLFLRESQQVLVYGYLTCKKSISKFEERWLEKAKSSELAGKFTADAADEDLVLGKLSNLNRRNDSIQILIPPGRPVFGPGIAKVYNKRTAFLGRFGSSLRSLIRENGLPILHERPTACLLNLYRVDSTTKYALLEVAYEMPIEARDATAELFE
jgi:hypothetical protein